MTQLANDNSLIVYKSDFCAHSWMVERLLHDHKVQAEFINIDGNPEARQAVIKLNNGYASVPTLLFPDGTHLTEPSLGSLRRKLNIETPSLLDRLRGLFGK